MARRNPKKIRPYLNQFIVKVPVSENFEFVDDEDPEAPVSVADDIEALRLQFLGMMAGTQEFNGRKLVNGLGYCNRGDLQSFISTHSLDWTISAFEGETVTQNRVLSHLLPDIDEDENGDPVYTPITDCTGRLNTIAGHEWTY